MTEDSMPNEVDHEYDATHGEADESPQSADERLGHADDVTQPGAPTEEDIANDPLLWGGQTAQDDPDLPDEEGDAGVGDVDLSDDEG